MRYRIAGVTCVGIAVLSLGRPAAAAQALTLRNGLDIAPYPADYPWDTYRYYGCQDTVLDPGAPDANFGRDTVQGLVGGANRKVLIQFRDLHRAIGPNKTITSASLVLHVAPGTWATGNAVKVYRLLKPWRQGSMTAADLMPQHWTSSFNYRLYSASAGEALLWNAPGAAGAGVDRATTASVTTTTTAGYSSGARTWTISGLAGDVALFYNNETGNGGWIIEYTTPASATGQNLFYSSEAVTLTLRPELLINYTDQASPPPRDIDLTVTYIARTPEYYRYNPVYEYKTFHDDSTGIMKNPGYATQQKWPNNGDAVTFTAHVRNQGTTTASGPFNYRWLMNGEVIATGTEATGIAAGAEKTYPLNRVWDANDYAGGTDLHCKSRDHRDRVLTFEVDTGGTVAEQCENNNSWSDFSEAPGMGFYVEQSFYNLINSTLNQAGSYSFEDWLKWHVQVWNDSYMEMSRFEGFAEDGCLERVRIQKIQVVADNTLAGGNHIPGGSTNFRLDGEWGFEWDAANSPDYITKFTKLIEGGLLHECTHQLGMIDLYAMNNEAGTPTTPVRVFVRDGGAYYISRGYYPFWMGLMAGDDTRYNAQYEATGLYEDWTCGALTSNTGYRRGFYGEELYDVPNTVRIRALDGAGNPIPLAQFKIWQGNQGRTSEYDGGGNPYPWQPIVNAAADAAGVLTLPTVGTLESGPFTTLTGHTLKNNPWGRINVVGVNGSLLVKVSAYGQRDYRFVRISQFNCGYWRGHTDDYTYDLQFDIAPDANVGTTNIAQGKAVTSNVGGTPGYAVDGDVNTRWDPGNVPVGTYFQVNLGANYDVAKVVLFQNGWGGDFFQQFRIETSLTGSFTGEQRLFAREPLNWGNACAERRDMDPADPEQDALWVTYADFPYAARYIRITCEQAAWTKLAELRVYAAGVEGTPPGQVTDLAARRTGGDSVELSWTAPGDDGFSGVAEAYDIRYATVPITPASFASATPAAGPPAPLPGGLTQTMTLGGLTGDKYYFALKAVDNSGNWSALSNVAASIRGDLNCDGAVNFDDINPFVTALISQAAYEAGYPGCDWLNADCNADGAVDFDDINPFVALLVG
jgi:hypothetical protein